MDLQGFDANTVAPSTDYEPLPAGEYLAMIVGSEEKETKSGDGSYLQLSIEVQDGEHKGRLLWDRLNLNNKNETAVKIARATLSAICHATGVMMPKMSESLHDKPMLVKVVVEERSDKPGSFKNEIKGYKPKSQQQQQQTTDGAKKAPPWKK
jgi:hypothetical protein